MSTVQLPVQPLMLAPSQALRVRIIMNVIKLLVDIAVLFVELIMLFLVLIVAVVRMSHCWGSKAQKRRAAEGGQN
ncbi:MAG: hypothetical protein NVS3B5_06600 [Sphingomicrobium sp.]